MAPKRQSPDGQRRAKTITIKVTPAEWSALNTYAESRDTNLAGVVRAGLAGTVTAEYWPPADMAPTAGAVTYRT